MKLHEQIRSGRIQNVDNLTIEMLDKISDDGQSAWHIAAKNGILFCIPEKFFNPYSMMKQNCDGETVWGLASMISIDGIPEKLFSRDVLIQLHNHRTVFDNIIRRGTHGIPDELITEELFNLEIKGHNPWHTAAYAKRLCDIPSLFFTDKALKSKNAGIDVWCIIGKKHLIKDVPIHLITPELLTMSYNDKPLFNKDDIDYINEVINKLDVCIKALPLFEKDIIHRDPRLILIDIQQDSLLFKFKGTDTDSIILNENGVFFNDTTNRNFKSLNNIVTFIENNFDVEKSITIPQVNNTQISDFSL